ncbi:MAG: DUF6057 family protein [Mediterranea sp.]|jgi:hypothetical protein|nr:DUF6057 family protein [Mediterranea sp.]
MKPKEKKIAVVAGLCCLVAGFAFFQFYYPYHLFYREQMLLFLSTPGYLSTYFDRPAWFSCLCGDYLTQYYYLIGGGAAVLSVALVLWGGLVGCACRQMMPGAAAFAVALAALVAQLFRNFGLNYELSSTLSLTGGVVLFLLHLTLIRRNRRWLWLALLLLPVAYWFFGCGIWMYLLLTTAYSLIKSRQYGFLPVGWAIALLVVWLPRGHYLLTAKQAFIYPSTDFVLPLPDIRAEKLLAMDTHAYRENWQMVLQLAERSDIQNSLVSYYRNLAQSMTGNLPDGLMNFYQPAALGLFQEVSANNSIPGIRISNEVWFTLGDMTAAEHSAILGMIFSPHHRSSRLLKRLAEINLVKGDDDAAVRFLRMLEQTKFHKQWATSRLPENRNRILTERLARRRSFVPQTDLIVPANDHPARLRHLLRNNPENQRALDYLLCYDLLTKDVRTFAEDYRQHADGRVTSRLYYEALLIYLAARRATPEEALTYRIPTEIVREFNAYTKLYEQHRGNPAPLQSQYGKSYWFYYHFATFKSTP